MFVRKLSLIIMSAVVALLPFATVHAATSPTTPAAKISFTFDDGLASTSTQAAPILAKYGLTGTDYVITGCVGMTRTPNTCRANTKNSYMTWAQIQALQNSSGWEVGSHTVDHDCLADSAATDPSDCQTNSLSQAQVDAELADSQAALVQHGLTATDFSAPYGDYNNMVLAEVAKYYASMRGFKEQNGNGWPYNDYLLNDVVVQEGVTPVSVIEADIDQAIASNSWLVLTFHDIRSRPSTRPENYQYGIAELDQIAAYAKAKINGGSLRSVHVSQGLAVGSPNLLANASFDDGVADGWSTDAPSNVVKNTSGNGSYPSPTNSIELDASTRDIHLFSPKVGVTFGQKYLLKSFLNVAQNAGGGVGYYIDEYDQNGNWVSGQYKKTENSSFVEDMNFEYSPSSARVAQASLQIIVTANSGIKAYVDNAQWYSENLTVTPPPVPTNLMPNGNFDQGLSQGWATDDAANIIADATGMGSGASPQTSIKLSANATRNTHLFSPSIVVDPTKSYSVSSYLNLQSISSGVFGYYIDEYDTSGNWISGQYKTDRNAPGSSTVGFTYTPSSSSVAKASLQFIVVGGAGITAYVDNVSWTQN